MAYKSNLGSGLAWIALVLVVGYSLAAKEKQQARPLISIPPPEPVK